MPEHDSPEKHLWVGADMTKDLKVLVRLAHKMGNILSTVKLGPIFLKQNYHARLIGSFASEGVSAGLDSLRSQNAEQMAYLVRSDETDGFKFTTVAAKSTQGLIAAGLEQSRITVVAGITSGNTKMRDAELEMLEEANDVLDDEHQIKAAICGVADISAVRNAGIQTVVATGIRLPHQGKDDHYAKATPEEAINMGASIVAVCRPITRSNEPFEEIPPLLESIARAL